jgi:hypothetical protein
MDLTEILSQPAFWIVVAAGSELIALSNLKGNSWVEMLFQVLYSMKPGKR